MCVCMCARESTCTEMDRRVEKCVCVCLCVCRFVWIALRGGDGGVGERCLTGKRTRLVRR